jgi:hypothetical protein
MNLLNFTDRELQKATASYTYTYGAYMVMLDELLAELKITTDIKEKSLILKEIKQVKTILQNCTLVLEKTIGEC